MKVVLIERARRPTRAARSAMRAFEASVES